MQRQIDPLTRVTELEALLQAGLDPDSFYLPMSRTRLAHYFASLGYLSHLQLLHRYHANFQLTNIRGQTVRDQLMVDALKNTAPVFQECLDWLDGLTRQPSSDNLSFSGSL